MSSVKTAEENEHKQTFVLQILSKENATWQGSLHWAETNKTVQFRSALEMIMMIESALEDE